MNTRRIPPTRKKIGVALGRWRSARHGARRGARRAYRERYSDRLHRGNERRRARGDGLCVWDDHRGDEEPSPQSSTGHTYRAFQTHYSDLHPIVRSRWMWKNHIGKKGIEKANIPLAIVVTDIEDGEHVILRRGRAALAVRASTCIPGMFVPVEIDGRKFVDGGLTENLPLSPLREMDAEIKIGVNVVRWHARKEVKNCDRCDDEYHKHSREPSTASCSAERRYSYRAGARRLYPVRLQEDRRDHRGRLSRRHGKGAGDKRDDEASLAQARGKIAKDPSANLGLVSGIVFRPRIK